MKRILALAVVVAFLIMPSVSSAKQVIGDSDLEGVFGTGSFTIDLNDDIYVKSRTLKTTSTDLSDFWGDNHAIYFGPAHPDYENNYNPIDLATKGYLGYSDVYLTGGLVKRSGTMTLEIVSTDDPNIKSKCKLQVSINSQTIEANIGIDAAIKLGTTSDLSGDQYLGRTHASGISTTTNGNLTVYAHNNNAINLFP